ncbi:hypothetical protein AB3329_06540 [Streptococcus sp. H31]|uniref:hypothetical protein n=1 Tax=Streptococcus huangxiaojuni TaxID=3237239 RepID=UPI0034A46293
MSPYNAVTLYAYAKEDLGAETIKGDVLERTAGTCFANLKEEDLFDGLTGSRAAISGNDAYQIYGTAKNKGKLFYVWFFTTKKMVKFTMFP